MCGFDFSGPKSCRRQSSFWHTTSWKIALHNKNSLHDSLPLLLQALWGWMSHCLNCLHQREGTTDPAPDCPLWSDPFKETFVSSGCPPQPCPLPTKITKTEVWFSSEAERLLKNTFFVSSSALIRTNQPILWIQLSHYLPIISWSKRDMQRYKKGGGKKEKVGTCPSIMFLPTFASYLRDVKVLLP